MILHIDPLQISVHSILDIREARINRHVNEDVVFFIDWFEEAITQLGLLTKLEVKLNYYPLPENDYSYELLLHRAMECVGRYAQKDYAKTHELRTLYGLVTHYFNDYSTHDRFEEFCRIYWKQMMDKHDKLMLEHQNKELTSTEEGIDAKVSASCILEERKALERYVDLKAIYLFKDDLLGPIEGRY